MHVCVCVSVCVCVFVCMRVYTHENLNRTLKPHWRAFKALKSFTWNRSTTTPTNRSIASHCHRNEDSSHNNSRSSYANGITDRCDDTVVLACRLQIQGWRPLVLRHGGKPQHAETGVVFNIPLCNIRPREQISYNVCSGSNFRDYLCKLCQNVALLQTMMGK